MRRMMGIANCLKNKTGTRFRQEPPDTDYNSNRKVNQEIGSLISEQFAALEDAEAANRNMDKNRED